MKSTRISFKDLFERNRTDTGYILQLLLKKKELKLLSKH